jgi:hypothetical protein
MVSMKKEPVLFEAATHRWTRALVVLLCLVLTPTLALSKENPQEKKPGSVRVYRFDNLDIEGNVKTPQLLYFLKRIRNRFHLFRITEPTFKEKIVQTKSADFL